MRKQYKFALLAFSIFMVGCNSTANDKSKLKEEIAAAEKSENYVCKTVKKTGSNLNTRRCMTKEAYEKQRDASREVLNELDRTYTTGGN